MSKKAESEVADNSADTVMDVVLSENQAKLNKLNSSIQAAYERRRKIIRLHSRLLIRIAAEQNGVLLLVHIRYTDKAEPDKVLVVIVIGINKDSEELLKVDNRAVLRDNCLSHCSHLSL